MLIRVVTTRADVPRTGERIAFVHGEIQPKIVEIDGNRGFLMAMDRSAGRYVSVAAWSDAEALEASGSGAPGLIADLVGHLHGTEPSVEVFDLVLAHVVKPVRLGYWGQLARFEMPPQDLARATQKFRQVVPAWFERYPGLAAIILFTDEGVLGGIIWWDSLHALRGSASRIRELRDVLAADIPTIRLVEDSELEAVIAEMSDLNSVTSPPAGSD
jgi:hypothetical protein